jgi:hypothetical protein
MTAQISAYGRLVADPRPARPTAEQAWQWRGWRWRFPAMRQRRRVNLLAGRYCFWEAGRCAGKAPERRPVSVAGNMQLNQWTGQDGGTQQGYQVVADSVISARTVRPGGKAGQQTGNGRAETCAAIP